MKEGTNKLKTVVFDFDGVVHSYTTPWTKDCIIPDPPVLGIKEALKEISEAGYEIVIVSARGRTPQGYAAIKKWLTKYDLWQYISRVSVVKPPAIVYIDDRAIYFDGHPENLLNKIKNFKVWYKGGKIMNMDLLMCKAIREDYHEWVEGFYRYDKTTGRSTVYMVDGGNCVVYEDTVCRSTGYRDTNGKMIYEGDLISTESRFVDNPLGEVKFGNNYEKDQFVIAYYGGIAWDTLGVFVRAGVEKNYIVVGNIYDHYYP